VLSPVTALQFERLALRGSRKPEPPNQTQPEHRPSQPRGGPPVAALVANEVTGGGVWACFGRPRKRKPQVRSFGFPTASQITNHKSQITSSLTQGRGRIPTSHQRKRRAASDGHNLDTLACHVVGTCVIKRTCRAFFLVGGATEHSHQPPGRAAGANIYF
jgi:hypothetical protein